MSITDSGMCDNCGRKKVELLPVFIEGRTRVGKCEYWCIECLRNRNLQNAHSKFTSLEKKSISRIHWFILPIHIPLCTNQNNHF